VAAQVPNDGPRAVAGLEEAVAGLTEKMEREFMGRTMKQKSICGRVEQKRVRIKMKRETRTHLFEE